MGNRGVSFFLSQLISETGLTFLRTAYTKDLFPSFALLVAHLDDLFHREGEEILPMTEIEKRA